MFSLEVRAPNTVEVGFRNVLSFVCNYIIREVGAIYSNKSSRICSDRYTSEGILLNGLISLHLSSPPIPLVSKRWCPCCGSLGFPWEGALLSIAPVCAALAGVTAPEQPLPSTGWGALVLLQLWRLQAPAVWLQPTQIWKWGLCLASWQGTVLPWLCESSWGDPVGARCCLGLQWEFGTHSGFLSMSCFGALCY